MQVSELRIANSRENYYEERFYFVPSGDSIDVYYPGKDGSLMKLARDQNRSWQIRGEVFYRTLDEEESRELLARVPK